MMCTLNTHSHTISKFAASESTNLIEDLDCAARNLRRYLKRLEEARLLGAHARILRRQLDVARRDRARFRRRAALILEKLFANVAEILVREDEADISNDVRQ